MKGTNQWLTNLVGNLAGKQPLALLVATVVLGLALLLVADRNLLKLYELWWSSQAQLPSVPVGR